MCNGLTLPLSKRKKLRVRLVTYSDETQQIVDCPVVDSNTWRMTSIGLMYGKDSNLHTKHKTSVCLAGPATF